MNTDRPGEHGEHIAAPAWDTASPLRPAEAPGASTADTETPQGVEEPVVDEDAAAPDVEQARSAGTLRAVADKLRAALSEAGLESFGHAGDPFDSTWHAAVEHEPSDDPQLLGPTLSRVHRRGYRLGDRQLRAALVAVADPTQSAAAADSSSGGVSRRHDQP